MKEEGWIKARAYIKTTTHINPDGTKIESNAIDIKNYEVWDENSQEWKKPKEK